MKYFVDFWCRLLSGVFARWRISVAVTESSNISQLLAWTVTHITTQLTSSVRLTYTLLLLSTFLLTASTV